MSTNDPRQPVSIDQGIEGDDRVEVLVEDLFIEEYPGAVPPEEPEKKSGRLARAIRPLRGHKRSLLGGLIALGGLVLATLFFGSERRSRARRFMHRLGLAR